MTSAAAASPVGHPGPPARPAHPGARAGGRWIRRFWYYLPAVLVFVGTISAWELVVRNVDLRGLPLPAPSAIVTALGEHWTAGRWPLAKAAAATLFEAVGGLAIGTTPASSSRS